MPQFEGEPLRHAFPYKASSPRGRPSPACASRQLRPLAGKPDSAEERGLAGDGSCFAAISPNTAKTMAVLPEAFITS